MIIVGLSFVYFIFFRFIRNGTDFYYPCDKQGYCNQVLDFFHVNNLVRRTHLDSLLHNEFKFLMIPCILSLEVTHTLGKEKVLRSNLNRACFFSQTGSIVSNKIVGLIYLSAYVLSAYFPHPKVLFFCCRRFSL